MRQPETKLKDRFHDMIKLLQKDGAPIWRERIQQVAIKGTPDELLCVNGFFVACELKRSSKIQPKGIQLKNLESIVQDARGIAFRVTPDNLEWVREQLIEIVEYKNPLADIQKRLWEQSLRKALWDVL